MDRPRFTPDDGATSLIDVLAGWREHQPEKTLFRFLSDAEGDKEDRRTFADLDRRAKAIASRLARLGLRDERALLLFPPGLEFIDAFLGCLYAGVVAVPSSLGRA